jgi:hypothetical protein
MTVLLYQCACGEVISPSRWRAGKRQCLDCAISKMVSHVDQMKRKSGPAWDRYCQVMGGIMGFESKADSEEDHGSQGHGSVDH